MEIQITNIKKKDYKKAIQFAKTGMHFDLYLDNKFLLYLYGNYFWYDEPTCYSGNCSLCGRKTRRSIVGGHQGKKRNHTGSFGKTMYIQIFNLLQKLFYKGGAGVYDTTNQALFREYRKCHCPDGQIVFLAANPAFQQKGIGSKLLGRIWSVVKKENRSTYIPMMLVPTNFMNAEGFSGQERKKWCWILAVKKYL